MKKFGTFFLGLTILFCINALAVNIGDSINYSRNSSRTSWMIKGASGSLTVMEHNTHNEYGPGYVIKMSYELDVLIRGKQKGDIEVFLPESVFGENFYETLSKNQLDSFGAFDLQHMGREPATDNNGMIYQNCMTTLAQNIDHNYQPAATDKNMARVLSIKHQGTIQSVKDLKITLRTHPGIKVLNAVQIDVSGTSNFGVGFKVGLDANF